MTHISLLPWDNITLTMESQQCKYYTFQYCNVVNDPEPKLVIWISEQIFDSKRQCQMAAHRAWSKVRMSWSGQLLECANKNVLHDLYLQNKCGQLTSYGKDVTAISEADNMDARKEMLLYPMCPSLHVIPPLDIDEMLAAVGC